MEIKTTLKKLFTLFFQSASNEELPDPIRQFSAQLTILTAHVERVEAKVDAEVQARQLLDKHVAELATLIIAAQPQRAPAPANAAAKAPTAAPATAPSDLSDDEAAVEEMVAKIQQETAAEAAEIVNSTPAAVAPLRKVNGGKAPNAGDAA